MGERLQQNDSHRCAAARPRGPALPHNQDYQEDPQAAIRRYYIYNAMLSAPRLLRDARSGCSFNLHCKAKPTGPVGQIKLAALCPGP